MRQRVAAIIIQKESILVIHRKKNGDEYFTLPGGGVDEGETLEQAAEREVLEETTVIGKAVRAVYTHQFENNFETYLLCECVSGEPSKGTGEEYINMTEANWYEPIWLPMKDLPNIRLLPTRIRDALIIDIKDGFKNRDILDIP